jgi:transposase
MKTNETIIFDLNKRKVIHLVPDHEAKTATVSKWSNGQTEGQVNRLKVLKRQMYERAKFYLLKAKVFNPA